MTDIKEPRETKLIISYSSDQIEECLGLTDHNKQQMTTLFKDYIRTYHVHLYTIKEHFQEWVKCSTINKDPCCIHDGEYLTEDEICLKCFKNLKAIMKDRKKYGDY